MKETTAEELDRRALEKTPGSDTSETPAQAVLEPMAAEAPAVEVPAATREAAEPKGEPPTERTAAEAGAAAAPMAGPLTVRETTTEELDRRALEKTPGSDAEAAAVALAATSSSAA